MTTTIDDLTAAVSEVIDKYDDHLRREPDLSGGQSFNSADSRASKKPEIPEGSLDPIIRPNGEAYIPRFLKHVGTTDVQFVRTAYGNEMPVLLYGPPGTGKTALLEAAFPNLITLMGTAETETSDFIGSWVQQPDGMYQWIDGPLIVAMEGGFPFLVDEIALVDARVMSVAYSVMDGRKELPITANPARGTVTAQPGFVVYGSCNPNVPGAVMSDALLSRFSVHVEVMSDWDLAAKLDCGTKIITAARNLNAKAEAHELTAAPQIREVITFAKVNALYGEEVAVSNLTASARPEDRAVYVEVLSSVFGKPATALKF